MPTQTKHMIDIKEAITNAKNIAIMPSKVAGPDAFAAGAGLLHILRSQEKTASFIYQGKKPEEAVDLIKDEDILSDVTQRELLVSIDYSSTSASKVHYSTENDILYLSISPVDKNFDLKKIKAEIKGFNYDLIITIGAQHLEDYGQLHSELTEEFSRATIINLDNTESNTRFGAYNLVDPLEHSLSLLTLNKAIEWGLKPDAKAAKALLSGITYRN